MTAEPRPILIGYDGSAAAVRAIEEAAAAFPRRRAVVLHVWAAVTVPALERFEAITRHPAESVHGVLDDLNQAAGDIAREVAADGAELASSQGLNAEARAEGYHHRGFHATTTEIAATIARVAEELGVAAAVLGTGGISPSGPLRLGSVAYRTLHECRRPVMLVPRPDHT